MNKVTSSKVEVDNAPDITEYDIAEIREYVSSLVKDRLKNSNMLSLLRGLQAAIGEAALINNERKKGD